MPKPTDEEMQYADVLRWVNWAVQNGEATGTFGQIIDRALSRMSLPKPLEEMQHKLTLATVRIVMNGPLHVDTGPEPTPYKKQSKQPEKVELKVKDVRPILVTPPPKLLN